MRILLIAEDAVRAPQVCAVLEEHGHDMFQVARLCEASEALEIQRFQFVLRVPAPGTALNSEALDRFQNLFQRRDRPLLIILREDPAATELLHMAAGETGVDAVIEGRFSPARLVELVDGLVHKYAARSNPAAAAGVEAALPVFERDQFERQMNYDRRLMAEIIQLFLSETSHQMVELERALDAGLDAQVKRLAHTLKGSFGAVYAHQAGALALEMEAAAADGLGSARRIMPRLELAAEEIRGALRQMLVD